MPALFLNILKLTFIGLVYLFLWQVARAMAAHVGAGGGLPRTKAGGAQLVLVRSEGQAGARLAIQDVMVMGRSPDADFLLDDPYASEFHMRLVMRDGQIVLHDLGSTNGTYVNGRRVTVPTPLSKGDAVQVGKTIMEVQ